MPPSPLPLLVLDVSDAPALPSLNNYGDVDADTASLDTTQDTETICTSESDSDISGKPITRAYIAVYSL